MKKLFTLSLGLFLGAGLLVSANLKSEKTAVESESKTAKISFYFVSKEVKGTMQGTAKLSLEKGNLDGSSFEGTARVATINTEDKKRDEHLKSADYFNMEKYPTISIKSKSIVKGEKGHIANCEVTIKDVTKDIKLNVKKTESGWEARGSLYASDFGVSPSKVREESLVKIKITI